jgi:hypothetical protein
MKDFGIPVTVFKDDTIFRHQCDVLNEYYPVKEALELAEPIDSVLRQTVIDEASYIIGENENFKNMLTMDMNEYGIRNSTYSRNIQKLYHPENHMKMFTSIDLCEANFQMVRKFNAVEYDTWKDFIASITEYDYFKRAKKLRQILFGTVSKALPGRLQTLQRWAMEQIVTELIERMAMLPADVFGISADEIILHGRFEYLHINSYRAKVETFRVHRIGKTSMYYKKYLDGSIELKCVPSTYVCQVIKHILGKSTVPEDYVFQSNDGLLAKYMESCIK